MKTMAKSDKKVFWLQILKGGLASVSLSLILILAFALIIQLTSISDRVIMPVNQGIKIISIFVGVALALKTNKNQGFFKGVLIGFLYTILAFVVFSILSGTLNFGFATINDFAFSGLLGGLSGVIVVNLKK